MTAPAGREPAGVSRAAGGPALELVADARQVLAPGPSSVRQQPSHAVLLGGARDPGRRPETATLDAIVVPAARGAASLRSALDLSARLGVQLVALCSRRTRAFEVAELASRTPGARVLAIDVPAHYTHAILPGRTAASPFTEASVGRTSDLSLKRNLGLLLARLHGWGKILFLDDDIATPRGAGPGLDAATVQRLGRELDSRQVAGLVCRSFPDNSVVCHARRLAGLPQDNFVTGGALGVNCSDQPLPFFPDIYNEDWFFFSRHAASRELSQVGEARQTPYDPYENPLRARQEEFGDLLAEGLYALFDRQPTEMPFDERLRGATAGYWEHFIAARRADLTRTAVLLRRRPDRPARRAVRSLRAATDQLDRIGPQLCADFLTAWQADLADWERATLRLNGLGTSRAAVGYLGLSAVEPTGLLEVG
ncbi:hypothetical protein [Kineosporia succinea]|uniref:Glycosyl transferase family 2 n=1 Tax=Kineosporia succinea TaxID=84632 RepID=A0ABT9NZE2_9ACTN|nr:hypothetical protein [Kineosporia succinea]MDP9825789.1 hypothetical protein [Kineosporia succinea]